MVKSLQAHSVLLPAASSGGPRPARELAPGIVDRFERSTVESKTSVLIPPPPAGPLRAYYDAQADQKRQELYYGDLKLSDNAQEAFDQLSDLVTQTHTTKLSYNPETHVYPWVELRPNGHIESIYSPHSVVEVSQAKQQAVDNEIAKNLFMAPLSPETLAAHSALVGLNGAINCEHVVPQSWYDAKEPMRGDLHHLFACDSRCNSYRGNKALRPLDQPRQSCEIEPDSVPNCGGTTKDKHGFEPMAGKGAVARATLYFILRYPKKAKGYSAEDVEALKEWARREPPSLYERHRNEAIQEKQGNRNPFIDRPEWIEKVDFTPGLRKIPLRFE